MLNLTLFKNNCIVAVALSGGMDSMCLLHLLLRQKGIIFKDVVAINVEHGLRGEESLSDSRFVKDYCSAHGITLYPYSVDGKAYAKEHKIPEEEAARILRYDCFFDCLNRGLCDCVATAHHMSDNVESVLFNLFRGCSLKGAGGMNPSCYDGKILRPLLNTPKQDICDYIEKNGIPYVFDSTNADENLTRNYIRRTLSPAIKKVFPSFEENVARFASLAMRDEEYLDSLAQYGMRYLDSEVSFPLDESDAIFDRRVISSLKYLGVKKDFTYSQVRTAKSILLSPNGTVADLIANVKIVKDYDCITIYIPQEKPTEEIQFTTGEFSFGKYKISISTVPTPDDEKIVEDAKSGIFYIDANKIPASCVIRSRKDGDVFTQFGGNTKKLKEFFIDKKISARKRNFIPLLCRGNKVLIVGEISISNEIKVDKTTSVVIKFNAYKGE